MNKIRVGLAGSGNFGAEIASCLAETRGVQLAAVADTSAERAHAFAGRFQIPRVFTDTTALAAFDGIDAVIVATPEMAHLEPVLSALDAGKHVLVEKPMAHTSAAALQMAEKAKSRGLLLMPGHIVRFEERARTAHARLANAGRIRTIRCSQHRPKSAFATYKRTQTALVMMLHHLDLCHWFAKSEVEHVECREEYLLGNECPSLVWATLHFKNGAVATLQSGYTLHDNAPSSAADAVEIVTENERISMDFSVEGMEIATPAGIVRPDLSYGPALRRELDHWLGCIESGAKQALVTPQDGVEAVRIAEMLIECGRKNRAH